ncbi:hypothetical protein AAES_44519 [Amazona aestiva]|uniref:Uncharacterized protein n=1 Tax=Amazona aestiva TaxID=12930 RepID=A0A0Q3UU80_AMAAE|nr:hypothetical protein AAES_44519 [Amazona aestiva]
MKRIFGLGRKRKGQPPLGSAAPPRPAGAYDLRQKDLGKLHRAAACGDVDQVRRGLKKHGVDGRDKAERTPLHLACANGHVDVVTYLIENKCKLNLFDNDNRSPLMKAVQCQQEKCVAILLEHGADPNLADVDGNTALHLAVISPNTSVAGLLLEHNANIDAENKEGCTPLILAVSEHQEEIVEFLLKKGADVHARDQCERTPLMTAASGGELNLIKVLLHYGADVSHKDTNGWTAEDYAVIHGYSSLSKQLSEYTDWKNTGEASASDAHSTQHQAGACDFPLGVPAMDRGETGIEASVQKRNWDDLEKPEEKATLELISFALLHYISGIFNVVFIPSAAFALFKMLSSNEQIVIFKKSAHAYLYASFLSEHEPSYKSRTGLQKPPNEWLPALAYRITDSLDLKLEFLGQKIIIMQFF